MAKRLPDGLLNGLTDMHTHAIGEQLPDLPAQPVRCPSIGLPAPDAARILPRLDHGAWMARSAGPRPSERARALWCDWLTDDAASLRLSLHRFGAEHVVLGAVRSLPWSRPRVRCRPRSTASCVPRSNALSRIGARKGAAS